MKPSRYNFIFEDNGQTYIYNSSTNSFAKIKKTIASMITASKKPIMEKHVPRTTFESLKKGGFIIDEAKDEIAEIKVRNRIGRFSSSSFGITLAPTMACNFKCRYCFEQPSTISMSNDVIEGVYNFVLRNLKDKSSFGVCWYGGEPLLSLDVIKNLSKRFILLCRTLDIPYDADIISNGFLMDQETARLLTGDLNVKFWQVTLDGPPRIHNERRPTQQGNPTFETIINNIKSCHQYFDSVSIRINVDKTNYEYVPELLEILEMEGLKNKVSVYLGMVQAFGSVCKSVSGQCFSEEEFSKIELQLYSIALQKGFALNLRPRVLTNYCSADRTNSFLIDPQGNLAKCWNSIGNPDESVGSVFKDILNDNYVKWLSYDPFQDPKCLNCSSLPICMGGCPYDAVISLKKACRSIKYNLVDMLKLHQQAVSNGL